MAERNITGTITKEKAITGSINKGIGMGELPQAAGLSAFLSPAYAVNGTDLTAVGEAVREKAGLEEAPVWPEGVVDGVGKAAVGLFRFVRRAEYMFYNSQNELPERLELYMPECTTVRSMFGGSASFPSDTLKHLVLTVSDNITNFGNLFQHAAGIGHPSIETVKINGNLCNVTGWNYTFFRCPLLHTIDADIDFSACSNYGDTTFAGCGSLENVRFVPNTVGIRISFGDDGKLSTQSVVSIANGLKAGTTTLFLHADVKARCETILGTVSTITDGETSYDFFTADENGDTTLTEFITQVKGWTLA